MNKKWKFTIHMQDDEMEDDSLTLTAQIVHQSERIEIIIVSAQGRTIVLENNRLSGTGSDKMKWKVLAGVINDETVLRLIILHIEMHLTVTEVVYSID
ncbi:hypothetical protein [Sediminibacterium soli]|uniref:hypothetical protein n=1 Tax=Sediminibacterium soli TaxID=2698829 RepID=UPI00137AF774|nr:hypothetical protein [Sediminibacterium soli]NCI48090.1 hypothetical protein [Sediminibacterium soli]